jgi:DNA-3-methyladenine glycosylase II
MDKKTVLAAEKSLAAACPVMAGLIAAHGRCPLGGKALDPFETLATSIVSQQLSTKAADSIKARLCAISPGLAPEGLLAAKPEDLRAAGLSGAKTRYILELAKSAADGSLDFASLRRLPDEEVADVLIKMPGVGRWTAEMFLIFGLRRPDVLSPGDAGLRRAARLLFGEDALLEVVSEPWRPHRSVASWYLWKHLDG